MLMIFSNIGHYLFLKVKMEPKILASKEKCLIIIKVLLFGKTQKPIAIV